MLFIDAINVKIRDGQVCNRPIYVVLGVTVDGKRDLLGLWAGEHGDGEGATDWLQVPTEAAALEALASFAAAWEARYPAIIRLWEHTWAEFVPFLAFDAEIRTVIARGVQKPGRVR